MNVRAPSHGIGPYGFTEHPGDGDKSTREQHCTVLYCCSILSTKNNRDRLGIPDLETMANNRAMRWIGNVARMHPGRLPQQVLYGWMPYPRPRGGQTKHQGHRINRILRERAANADPKIRHRFYKNGTDVSTITSDADPVNWHVVAQDRTTWTSTMLIDAPTNPTTTRT